MINFIRILVFIFVSIFVEVANTQEWVTNVSSTFNFLEGTSVVFRWRYVPDTFDEITWRFDDGSGVTTIMSIVSGDTGPFIRTPYRGRVERLSDHYYNAGMLLKSLTSSDLGTYYVNVGFNISYAIGAEMTPKSITVDDLTNYCKTPDILLVDGVSYSDGNEIPPMKTPTPITLETGSTAANVTYNVQNQVDCTPTSIPCMVDSTLENGILTIDVDFDLAQCTFQSTIGAATTTSGDNTQTTPNSGPTSDPWTDNPGPTPTEDPDPGWPWWAWLVLGLGIAAIVSILIAIICRCAKGCPGHPDYRKERERENQRRREEEYRLRSGRPAGSQDPSGRQGSNVNSNAQTPTVFNAKPPQSQGYNGSNMGNTAPYGNSNGGSNQGFNNPGYTEPPADYPSDGVARVQVGRY